MKKIIGPFVCALVMAAAPASALAASSSQRLAPQVKIAAADVNWVQASIQANMAVVAAGDLAEQRTTSVPALKLAHVLLSQHSKLLADAEHCAQRLGITIPSNMGTTYQAQYTALQALTGRAFAAQFASDEVTDHEAFITLTQTEIASGVNVVARASAKFWLPIEEHRLAIAEGAVKAIPAT
jgi:predicted outer membrane protein